MKRRFLLPVVTGIFALLLFTASTGFAQQKKHSPEERAKMMTDKMKTGITLTEDQYTKVYDLNLSFANKMQDLRKEQQVSKEVSKKSFKNLRQERNTALSAILSKEQMEKYKTLQKEQHKEMRNRREAGKAIQS